MSTGGQEAGGEYGECVYGKEEERLEQNLNRNTSQILIERIWFCSLSPFLLSKSSSSLLAHPQFVMAGDVDAWIASLRQCKTLSEPDVKELCDRVSER